MAVRGLGLWAGVDIDPTLATGKQMSLRLAERGVLVKDTHGSTLRFAPPLVITAAGDRLGGRPVRCGVAGGWLIIS